MLRSTALVCCLVCVTATEKWFTQSQDHFDNENHNVWEQRYFVTDKYYASGGPAFLQIGGEFAASSALLYQGHWIEIAKEVGAMAYVVEHRFYGESHPTNDTSVENLRYLTSEQALADLARFIQNMTAETGITKWVTFGGSYPGSLSLWMRLKYPTLIRGAMSASAPLLAKLDFFEYYEVINRSLTIYGGSECVDSLAVAANMVQEMLKSSEGRKKLHTTFNLCAPLQSGDDEYFQRTISGIVAGVVQYNRDGSALERATGDNVTIDDLCKHMTDKSLGDEMTRYATLPSILGNRFQTRRALFGRYKHRDNGMGICVDASYARFIRELQRPVFDSARTWVFQTCTEFGWFQTTDSSKQPFKGFGLDLFLDMCFKIYGAQFTPSNINDGIMETNANYGAKKIAKEVSNACLFNGGVDPWHAMSYVGSDPSSNPTFHTLYVASSAHCAIMYPESSDDPEELRAAKKLSTKYVKSWLV